MNQYWHVRGQAAQRKCPKCHARISWSLLQGSAGRIASARPQHFSNCLAGALDPKKLAKMSKDEVEAALADQDTHTNPPAHHTNPPEAED